MLRTPPTPLTLILRSFSCWAWSASLAAALDEEAGLQAQAFLTEDLREGAAAFVEKRVAKFTGR